MSFLDFLKKKEQLEGQKNGASNPVPQPVSPIVVPITGGDVAPELSRFDKAIRYVMVNEDGKPWDKDDGCYTNNPKDPGGRTIWGIIQTEYEKYIGRNLSEGEIRAMPRSVAINVYRKEFWLKIRGDEYDSEAVAIALMDTAVNKGLGGCLSCLRDATKVNFDTSIPYGLNIIAAVNMIEPKHFIMSYEAALERYIDARIERFPNMEWARKGWTNRARRLLNLIEQGNK